MEHTVDLQIFNRYQPKAVDYPTGMLMGEIIPAPLGTLMHAGYNLTPFGSLRCHLLSLAEVAMCFSKCFLLQAKETRVGYLICGG